MNDNETLRPFPADPTGPELAAWFAALNDAKRRGLRRRGWARYANWYWAAYVQEHREHENADN